MALSLVKLSISSTVTNIGEAPCGGCAALSEIDVDAQNSYFQSADGVLFDKGMSNLLQFPGGKAGDFSVPQGVKQIAYGAFSECAYLTNVFIPTSVTNVGNAAFYDSDGLSGVYFRGNAPAFGENVFDSGTLYYLTNTAGWNFVSENYSAALWNPAIQLGSTNFNEEGEFNFDITGTPGIPIVVEACTNCGARSWTPLQCLTLTNGLVHFTDLFSTNVLSRFYRIRAP